MTTTFIPGRFYSSPDSYTAAIHWQFVRYKDATNGYFVNDKGEEVVAYVGPTNGWSEEPVQFVVGKRYVYGSYQSAQQYELVESYGRYGVFKNVDNGETARWLISAKHTWSPVIEQQKSGYTYRDKPVFIEGRKYRSKMGYEATYIGQGATDNWGIFEDSKGRRETFYIGRLLGWSLVDDNTEKRNDVYIIWSPQGRTNPSVVHGSEEEAAAEAARMTIKHRQTFAVMEQVRRFDPKVTVEAVEVAA